MLPAVIDAHIHIDNYDETTRNRIIDELANFNIEALIAVSNNFTSAKHVQQLSCEFKAIKPAYGYHPEQTLPTEQELTDLLNFMDQHKDEMVAIGEVGLPYYKSKKNPSLMFEPYSELLESFFLLAKKYEKPVILHAVYEDAPFVCDLLEKHSIHRAHFHWFKGDDKTIERMIRNQYHISVTPDLIYKERTRNLVKMYPLDLIMVETDGPWPFEGPFKEEQTHPKMIHQSLREIAKIKKCSREEVYETIYKTTTHFYRLF